MPPAYRNDDGHLVKECSQCKVLFEDPHVNFYKNNRSKDGLQSACRPCFNKAFDPQNAVCAATNCTTVFESRRRTDGPRTRFCSRSCVSRSILDGLIPAKTRRCKECNKEFEYRHPRKRYCSASCNRKVDRRRAQAVRRNDNGRTKKMDAARAHGISLEDYERLFNHQGGLCAICGRSEKAKIHGKIKSLAVDHCHTTGKIRGLLCHRCNLGLGWFDDNVLLLRHAATYLLNGNITDKKKQLTHSPDGFFGEIPEYWKEIHEPRRNHDQRAQPRP
jgi:hypothetical protein